MKILDLHKIYLLLFSLLCFSIPFESVIRAAPNILLIALTLIAPFVLKKEHFSKVLANFVLKWVVIFFLFLFATGVINQTFINDFFVIKKVALVLPILLFSTPIKNVKVPILSFSFGVFVVICISFCNLFNYYIGNESFIFFKGDIINSILLVERLYAGFLATISFTIGLYSFSSTSNKLIRQFHLMNTLLSAVFIITISARMAIISIIIVCLIKAFKSLKFEKVLITLVSLFITVVIVFELNNNLKSRFFYPKNNDKNFIHKLKEWEPRYVIWMCSYEILNYDLSKNIIGRGFQNTRDELLICYKQDILKEGRKKWFLRKKYNSHNQFIDFLLSTGIVGLLIFISLLVYLIKKNRRDLFKLNLILILILFGIVENFLHRQIGVYLFALIIAFTNQNIGTYSQKIEK